MQKTASYALGGLVLASLATGGGDSAMIQETLQAIGLDNPETVQHNIDQLSGMISDKSLAVSQAT